MHEDCFLIYMTRTIDDLYDKQVNFTPKIDNLNEVLIDLHMDEQAPEKLERVLSEAHGFKFDTIRVLIETKMTINLDVDHLPTIC